MLLMGCVANIGLTLRRSLFLSSLDGEVSRIEVRQEKHPGLDDVYLVTVGPKTRVVDAGIASKLREGDRVHKARFAMHLALSRGGRVATPLSPDSSGMLLAMPVLMVLGALVLFGVTTTTQTTGSRRRR